MHPHFHNANYFRTLFIEYYNVVVYIHTLFLSNEHKDVEELSATSLHMALVTYALVSKKHTKTHIHLFILINHAYNSHLLHASQYGHQYKIG